MATLINIITKKLYKKYTNILINQNIMLMQHKKKHVVNIWQFY